MSENRLEDDIALSLAESLRSDLRAFIIDSRLVDVRVVDELLRKLGVSYLLLKQQLGSIVVYSFNRQSISKKCLYEKCSTLEPIARERCIDECVHEVEKMMANNIASEIENFLKQKTRNKGG